MHAADRSNDWDDDAPPDEAPPTKERVPTKTVLVVEDDEAVSSLLVDVVEARGSVAEPAMGGRASNERGGKVMPDLLPVDVALPGTDGHEVLGRHKADPKTRDSPFVVISAFTQIRPVGERK